MSRLRELFYVLSAMGFVLGVPVVALWIAPPGWKPSPGPGPVEIKTARIEMWSRGGEKYIDVYVGRRSVMPAGRKESGGDGGISTFWVSADTIFEVVWASQGIDGIWRAGGYDKWRKEEVYPPEWTEKVLERMNTARIVMKPRQPLRK